MRKINFRVWHKKESRWLDPWSEEDPMLCLKDFGNGCEVYLYDRQSKDWTNKDCQMDDVVIQQYAGLKDKNGVKIYEGDIFKDDDWWVGKEMVKFNNGIFGFSDEDNDRHVPLFECKRIEVIGNIFEGFEGVDK
jgi:uncharacterized phage protein (TIGR01671 family)